MKRRYYDEVGFVMLAPVQGRVQDYMIHQGQSTAGQAKEALK